VLTTLAALGLCAIPALCAGVLLIFGGDEIYRFLLRTAATVPPQATPIAVVLLAAGVLQIVADALLQHTGYFKSLAVNGAIVVAMMIAATGIALAAKLDLVGFLAAYALAYGLGAILQVGAAMLGPIRAVAVTAPRIAPR
jgi:multidrug transporter EmrE-like cation transporter